MFFIFWILSGGIEIEGPFAVIEDARGRLIAEGYKQIDQQSYSDIGWDGHIVRREFWYKGGTERPSCSIGNVSARL